MTDIFDSITEKQITKSLQAVRDQRVVRVQKDDNPPPYDYVVDGKIDGSYFFSGCEHRKLVMASTMNGLLYLTAEGYERLTKAEGVTVEPEPETHEVKMHVQSVQVADSGGRRLVLLGTNPNGVGPNDSELELKISTKGYERLGLAPGKTVTVTVTA